MKSALAILLVAIGATVALAKSDPATNKVEQAIAAQKVKKPYPPHPHPRPYGSPSEPDHGEKGK